MTRSTRVGMRPGGRSARIGEVLRETVLRLLDEGGYRALTIEKVAEESGVAKTTIYRRWAHKAEMVFELTLHGDSPPVLDQGGLVADLRAVIEQMRRVVVEAPGRQVLPGLVADLEADPALAHRLREAFVQPGRDHFAEILVRAHARGEVPGTAGAEQLQVLFFGTLYAQVQLVGGEPTEALEDALLRAAVGVVGASLD